MNEITQLLHIDPLLLQALREDIPEEDVSTNAVMPHACPGTVDLIAKEDGIVAGLAVYARVFTLLDPGAKVEFFCRDGDTVQPGQKLAVVTGDIRALLSGERVALNYLQRMSGIATYTHQLSALLEAPASPCWTPVRPAPTTAFLKSTLSALAAAATTAPACPTAFC